jgi:hypothetical protein
MCKTLLGGQQESSPKIGTPCRISARIGTLVPPSLSSGSHTIPRKCLPLTASTLLDVSLLVPRSFCSCCVPILGLEELKLDNKQRIERALVACTGAVPKQRHPLIGTGAYWHGQRRTGTSMSSTSTCSHARAPRSSRLPHASHSSCRRPVRPPQARRVHPSQHRLQGMWACLPHILPSLIRNQDNFRNTYVGDILIGHHPRVSP